jgi:2-keto-3-deoxy-6-phosphogluconate aldolase
MTDNDLYVAKATETIGLRGTAASAPGAVKWVAPFPVPAGTALSSEQLDAMASVSGRFVYSPAAGAKVAKGTIKLTMIFTPTDASKFKTTTATVDLVVQ